MTRMYGPAAFRKRDCAWVGGGAHGAGNLPEILGKNRKLDRVAGMSAARGFEMPVDPDGFHELFDAVSEQARRCER